MNKNCRNCALRMFNDNGYNIQGNGCWYYGNFLVISNIDNNKSIDFSKQLEIIDNISISSTGGLRTQEFCYVTPFIKCKEITYGADDNTIKNCINNLADEFKQFHPKRVMITGSAVSRFLHCDITENLDKIWISKNNIQYFVNYSPFIKNYDANKFEIFKQHLIKWFNCINNNDYEDYEINYL